MQETAKEDDPSPAASPKQWHKKLIFFLFGFFFWRWDAFERRRTGCTFLTALFFLMESEVTWLSTNQPVSDKHDAQLWHFILCKDESFVLASCPTCAGSGQGWRVCACRYSLTHLSPREMVITEAHWGICPLASHSEQADAVRGHMACEDLSGRRCTVQFKWIGTALWELWNH